MQLVAPLAAGMAGCESGHAEVYTRGSASRSSYYTDAEGTSSAPPIDVALDANGRANIYVNEHVDVQVFNEGGGLVTTFTVMAADRNVEVISQSFTGQAYAGGGSAASLPVDLQTVLDLWYDSAGSLDFQVAIDGTDTNIDTAIAGIYGHMFNVKAYGATGDGATDDRTAVLAAKSAADTYGGSVYFPEGTYLFGSSITWTDTPMVGVPGRSKLKSETSSDIIDFLGGTESASAVYGMEFDCGVTVSDDTLDYEITFIKCRFAPSSTSHANNTSLAFGPGSSSNELIIRTVACYFTHVVDGRMLDMLYGNGRFIDVGSTFEAVPTAGSSSSALQLIFVRYASFLGSVFDLGKVTTVGSSTSFIVMTVQVFNDVDVVMNGVKVFEPPGIAFTMYYGIAFTGGDRFIDVGGAYPGQDATSFTLYNFTSSLNVDDVDDIHIVPDGRRGRSFYKSGSISASDYDPWNYETIYLRKTAAGSLTVVLDNKPLPPGSRVTLVVENAVGAGFTLDVSGVDVGNHTSHTLANGNHTAYTITYLGANGVVVNAIQDK